MPLFREHPDGSFRSHNCTVVGDVKMGRQSSVWFNTVIRGDVAPITIGQRVNVQDQAVIHCDTGVPNVIGDDVTIGHGAIVHGAFVGEGSLIGMGATLLSQSKIGRGFEPNSAGAKTPGLPVAYKRAGLPGLGNDPESFCVGMGLARSIVMSGSFCGGK